MCWINEETQRPETFNAGFTKTVTDAWVELSIGGETIGFRVPDAIYDTEEEKWTIPAHIVGLGDVRVTHWRYPPAPPGNSAHKTASGRDARIVCDDRKGFGGKFPVLALVADDGGNEIAVPYAKDLKCEKNHHFPGEDLSIPPAPPESAA